MSAVLLALIRAYRALVAPHFRGACRFEPSCSAYAEQALRRRGAMRGSALAVRRVLRCHPFGAHGFDPVP